MQGLGARQSPDGSTAPRRWVPNSPQPSWESGAPALPAGVRSRVSRPRPRPSRAPCPSRVLDRAHCSRLLSSVTPNFHPRLRATRAGSRKPAPITPQVLFLSPVFPVGLAGGDGCAKPLLSPPCLPETKARKAPAACPRSPVALGASGHFRSELVKDRRPPAGRPGAGTSARATRGKDLGQGHLEFCLVTILAILFPLYFLIFIFCLYTANQGTVQRMEEGAT